MATAEHTDIDSPEHYLNFTRAGDLFWENMLDGMRERRIEVLSKKTSASTITTWMIFAHKDTPDYDVRALLRTLSERGIIPANWKIVDRVSYLLDTNDTRFIGVFEMDEMWENTLIEADAS